MAGACTQATVSGTETATDDGPAVNPASTFAAPATATTPAPAATSTPSTTEPPTATPPTSTDSTTTTGPTTTTTEPPLDVYDAACVVQVQPGDSLGAIVTSRADEIVTVASVRAENGLPDELIVPDQLLDV